jgi:alkanesulfonate monooxygenase SsuD/methylene tetrahydromethanopterin reductase-like flavin-dependent oxidoreductase (luciferase family)
MAALKAGEATAVAGSTGAARAAEPMLKVGIALPMQPMAPDELRSWAERLDASALHSVTAGERIAFENNDALTTLSVLAGATRRIKLMTSVIALPMHREGIVAKQAATLDRLSGGRFSLGVGIGSRRDDYRASPAPWDHRGARFEEQLRAIRRTWQGESPWEGVPPVGPPPLTPGGPEILVGAFAEAALQRAGRLADGLWAWAFAPDADQHRQRYAVMLEAWDTAGRSGRPRLVAGTHFALGPDALAQYETHVRDYYGYAPKVVGDALGVRAATTAAGVSETIQAFAEGGVDEIVFSAPRGCGPDIVDRLSDIVGSLA